MSYTKALDDASILKNIKRAIYWARQRK